MPASSERSSRLGSAAESRGNLRFFFPKEFDQAVHAIQVLRHHFLLFDSDAIGAFQKHYELEHARRINNAALQEGLVILQSRGISEQEIANHEFPNFFCVVHWMCGVLIVLLGY